MYAERKGRRERPEPGRRERNDVPLGADHGGFWEGKLYGLSRNARARKVELSRLEAWIAHEPTQKPIPERAVTPPRRPRAELGELKEPTAVDAERNRSPVAFVGNGKDRHGRAGLR